MMNLSCRDLREPEQASEIVLLFKCDAQGENKLYNNTYLHTYSEMQCNPSLVTIQRQLRNDILTDIFCTPKKCYSLLSILALETTSFHMSAENAK